MLRLLRTMQVGDVHDFVGRARLIMLPPLAPVVVAPREEVVARYCERLEAALGDDQRFSLIVKEFDNDAEVSTNELLLIAKRFGLGTTRSRTAAVEENPEQTSSSAHNPSKVERNEWTYRGLVAPPLCGAFLIGARQLRCAAGRRRRKEPRGELVEPRAGPRGDRVHQRPSTGSGR